MACYSQCFSDGFRQLSSFPVMCAWRLQCLIQDELKMFPEYLKSGLLYILYICRDAFGLGATGLVFLLASSYLSSLQPQAKRNKRVFQTCCWDSLGSLLWICSFCHQTSSSDQYIWKGVSLCVSWSAQVASWVCVLVHTARLPKNFDSC